MSSQLVMTYQVAFGRHVRQNLLRRDETQEEVAHRAGIHVTYLSGIERGVRNPSLTSICALAAGLGVPVSELFDFDAQATEPRKKDGSLHRRARARSAQSTLSRTRSN